jgi:hypothetical protein
MIFQGIAPSMRHTDPEFARFEARLFWHHITIRFTAFNEQLIKAFNTFGQSMQKAAESMRLMLPIFEKFNKEI